MSSKGQDLLLENFVKLVQTARDNNAKEMRLEVCIGQFLTNGNFVPGYNHRFRHVINRLLKRLEKNCEDFDYWNDVKKHVFIRANYPKGVTQTCDPNKVNRSFIIQKCVGSIDIRTSHPCDMRVKLSTETHVDPKKDSDICLLVRNNKPDSVRMLQRASFTETVYIDELCSFQLQFNISKISEPGSDKISCTNHPCAYHCQVELKDKLIPLLDKKLELEHNIFIANSILDRSRALLGTYQNTDAGILPLPVAKLYVSQVET
jgi:hypothetical protein